ncbi:MAG: enoyl-CoA hydratase-related protein [Candidatus Dadabacteria bacterium]|nr:enoyl-CoA hydratase-related protein [Candidatus Dadabacteria bacterium]
MYEDLLFESRDSGVGLLTINKKRDMNVLNVDTLSHLKEFVTEKLPAENLKVLIVIGAGTKAFVAGADVRQMSRMTTDEFRDYCALGRVAFDYLEQASFAVIAAINGYALGGGLELALSCDIRIASEKARVGFPETKLGLFPCWGGTQRSTRLIGPGKTKKLVFTGEMVTASEALSLGLVDKVVEQGELMDEVMKIAEQIAHNSPLAVNYAKKAINRGSETGLSEGLAYEMDAGFQCFDSYDRVEGMSAFVEKRTAEFKGE